MSNLKNFIILVLLLLAILCINCSTNPGERCKTKNPFQPIAFLPADGYCSYGSWKEKETSSRIESAKNICLLTILWEQHCNSLPSKKYF